MIDDAMQRRFGEAEGREGGMCVSGVCVCERE